MPPTTDAIVSGPAVHANIDTKSHTESNHARNNQLESLRYDGNDEDDTDYPEGGATAWLVVLGAWCAMMYVFEGILQKPAQC